LDRLADDFGGHLRIGGAWKSRHDHQSKSGAYNKPTFHHAIPFWSLHLSAITEASIRAGVVVVLFDHQEIDQGTCSQDSESQPQRINAETLGHGLNRWNRDWSRRSRLDRCRCHVDNGQDASRSRLCCGGRDSGGSAKGRGRSCSAHGT
jgi:hypothetical protein